MATVTKGMIASIWVFIQKNKEEQLHVEVLDKVFEKQVQKVIII